MVNKKSQKKPLNASQHFNGNIDSQAANGNNEKMMIEENLGEIPKASSSNLPAGQNFNKENFGAEQNGIVIDEQAPTYMPLFLEEAMFET
jgi:hypothetical protein